MGNSFHVVCLVAMGLWLIDNANLEDLARTAARLNRWEFLLTIAPAPPQGRDGLPGQPDRCLLGPRQGWRIPGQASRIP